MSLVTEATMQCHIAHISGAEQTAAPTCALCVVTVETAVETVVICIVTVETDEGGISGYLYYFGFYSYYTNHNSFYSGFYSYYTKTNAHD